MKMMMIVMAVLVFTLVAVRLVRTDENRELSDGVENIAAWRWEGQRAYHRNEPLKNNPYHDNEQATLAWNEGWWAAANEKQAENGE